MRAAQVVCRSADLARVIASKTSTVPTLLGLMCDAPQLASIAAKAAAFAKSPPRPPQPPPSPPLPPSLPSPPSLPPSEQGALRLNTGSSLKLTRDIYSTNEATCICIAVE